MLPQLAARIRSEGRANVHLTTQQRDLLIALRRGEEITTRTGPELTGVTAISQRGGDLERMGLVYRDHPERPNRYGKMVKVVRLNLTDLGRTVDLDFGSAQDDGQAEMPIPAARQARRVVDDLFGNQGPSDG